MSRKRLFFSIAVAALVLVVSVFWLAKVFSGKWVLLQSFFVGPLQIRFYGITMALAVGAGWWLATKRAPAYGIAYEQVDRILLLLIAGGFIGARLYHVVSSWQYYVAHPLDALKVWHGGLSIFGALFGGLIVLLFVVYRRKSFSSPKLLFVLDWLAPSVLLGQIIGRFGNLFNYEAYGYPTNLPWKMFVPAPFRFEAFASAQYFHPLFLYEALGNVLILFVLLKAVQLLKRGSLFFVYVFLYTMLRFGLEHLRVDSTFLTPTLRLNVVVSGVLCLLSLCGLLYAVKASKTANISVGKS
jgi:phosphatidylglycerol:prolipoprotein diacylglycerol transferase